MQMKLRAHCSCDELVTRIQDLIDAKKIRVWSVCDDQHLVLSHKKYGGSFRFYQSWNPNDVKLDVQNNGNQSESRLVGAMIGMLERHFKSDLASVKIEYHDADPHDCA